MVLKNIKLIKQGKVRDIYELDDKRLLIVSSDRISAFDHVLRQTIPDKGRILNLMSLFWFDFVKSSVDTHIISSDIKDLSGLISSKEADYLKDRFVIVKRVNILPFEFVVRAYITGSYYKMYEESYDSLPVPIPKGLKKNDELPSVILTPTTKSDEKDEALSPREVKREIGEEIYDFIETISCRLFLQAKHHAESSGFILVDTKFEFGMLGDEIVLADEIFTPDSSRYWQMKDYKAGKTPESYDKQIVRDYLESTGWDKKSHPPDLPAEIISSAFSRYKHIYEVITNREFYE